MNYFQFCFQRTLSAVTGFLVVIRIYVRFYLPHRERRWWGFLSEFFIVVAWTLFTIPVIVDSTGIWEKPETDVEAQIWLGKWVYWWWIEYIFIYYSIKASMLIFYNEWIPRVLTGCWWANRVLMVFTLCCFLTSAGLYAFWCWPISLNWTDYETCNNGASDPAWYVRFSFHLFTDVLIFVLPIFVIHQMTSLTLRKRMEASAMFLLGFFNIACALMVFIGSSFPKLRVPDQTIFIFQNLDQSVGILVVCSPALKVFIVRCYWFWSDRFPGGKERRARQVEADLEGDTKNLETVTGLTGTTKSVMSTNDPKKADDLDIIAIGVPSPTYRGQRRSRGEYEMISHPTDHESYRYELNKQTNAQTSTMGSSSKD